MKNRSAFAVVVTVLALVAGGLLSPFSANAVQIPQDRVVSDDPANFTPNVLDGTVYAVVQTGTRIILGGSFTQVQAAGSNTTLTRNNLLAFNATTGAIDTGFVPTVDGDVTSLAVSADGASVYVGGKFNNVNGVASKSLTRLNVTTGARVTSFVVPKLDAVVQDLKLRNGKLYIAGYFSKVGSTVRGALAALNADTGALLPDVAFSFAGTHNGGVTQVYKIDVTADGRRLVAIGNFTTVNGQDRVQAAMIDLTTSPASLADWQTNAYKPMCYSVFQFWVRDVEFSPDGAYFVVGATGGYGSGPPTYCDTATRWETAATGSDLSPTWADYTGGDTTYAVGVTTQAIYVGGHERWWNNPSAADSAGAGAVSRQGIAALDPTNGLPLSWNPTRTRGSGVFDFLVTPTGLWVASDTDRIGKNFEYHARIAFFPAAGGKVVPANVTGTLPGSVYQLGRNPAGAGKSVLYRVNAGGPTIPSLDGGPNWAGDTDASSTLRNSGSNASGWGPVPNVDPSVPTSTPSSVFDSERWDPTDAPEMQWAFPVPTGTAVQVRLYFANRCDCTANPGDRAFDVSIDGQLKLDHYDIVGDVGNQTGTMKSFDVTSDGTVNIDFGHETENPLVDGIEIVLPASSNDQPALYRVNAGGPPLLSGDGGPDWTGDSGDSPSGNHNGGSNAADWGSPAAGLDASVPASTPAAIFATERWDPGDATEMHWSFPVPPGTPLQVHLFFANRCGCTSGVGQRVFDVSIDGQLKLDHYDIVADVGDQHGVMKSYNITSDGMVNIDFGHEVENPLVNGIEIVRTDISPPPPGSGSADAVTRHTFDGSSAGPGSTPSNGGVAWGNARGAVMISGKVYFGWSDGQLYSRTYDGTTWGPAVAQDGADQVVPLGSWHSDVPNITSMFYENGRLYYTLYGQGNLFYRYFLPEDGIVGAQRFTAANDLSDVSWENVNGTFLANGKLWFVTRSDGELHRLDWSQGAPVAGTAVQVSGPAEDGIDWGARALFLYADASGAPPNQPPTAVSSVTCTDLTCSASGNGSSDPEGPIASYAWDFGDGGTGSGISASHTYQNGGSYTVKLTVTDGSGATAFTSKQVTVQAANVPPTAAFTVACTQLQCAFDGTGSHDPEGPVSSYAWTFGDGATGSGDKVTHPYAAGGSFQVTLTVTDANNATGSVTKTVNVSASATQISFVGVADQNVNAVQHSVVVPTTVQAGDTLVLYFTDNDNTQTITGPTGVTGWTVLGTQSSGAMTTEVWSKVATAADAGKTLTVSLGAIAKADLLVAAYRGTDGTSPIAQYLSAGEATTTASHTTPGVTSASDRAWRLSYWADKSATTTKWTAPAGVVTQSTSIGAGSGRITSLFADSGQSTGIGSFPGLTATADSAARATMVSILLKAGS